MEIIPREARRITYSTEIRNLKKLDLNNIQKAVITGSILGDGYLEPNWSKTNYRLSIGHSIDQKSYVLWKYDIFKNLVLTKPRFKKVNSSFVFRTVSHPEITRLRNIFYKNGKKIIPNNLFDHLSPLAIAVWFMDDGNLVKTGDKLKGFHLNTQSFSDEDNLKIKDLLSSIDINCSLERNKGRYRIGIWQKDSREMFIEIIKDSIINSMRYKLG